ncbi:MAG: fibronectin type III domain-containing protein, partial [Catenulispora sp.]|nr:fibronectin type III domain-containing protein [Catenulispora sp.]
MEMEIPNMGVPAELAARMSMAEQHEYLRSKFSRRGLIRGGAIAAGTAASLPLLAGTAGAATGSAQGSAQNSAQGSASPAFHGRPGSGAVDGALVAPYGRHLAFGAEPSSQFRVAWQTPVPVNRPYLRFGRSPLELGHKNAAETRALHT